MFGSRRYSSEDETILPEFLRAMRGLDLLTISHFPADHVPFDEHSLGCPKLAALSKSLGGSVSTEILAVDEAATIRRWREFVSNSSESKISARDCKRFYWVPEIVSDSYFHQLVAKREIPLTVSSLRGLMYCYHQRFSELSRSSEVNALLTDAIQDKANSRAIIRFWLDSIECLVGEKAPELLAKRAYDEFAFPEQTLAIFGFSSDTVTDFAARFAGRLAIRMAGRYETIPDERLRGALDGYLGSNLVRKEAFNEAVSELITSRKAERSEFVQGVLIDFLFEKRGLGDPRINPENWTGIEEAATTRVVQWLSREDINFFFELLLRDKDDKHGRKAFWLQYADKVARSRALISREDIKDHSVRLREMEEKGRSYGRLDGVNSSSSFILDFGKVVVVEFSEVGNACYIYTKNDFLELIPDFWAKDVSFRSLKNQAKVSERITRSVKDWQANARQILSRYGVRRG
jgi:hypothetical protein